MMVRLKRFELELWICLFMAVTDTGPLTNPLQQVLNILSQSASFQAWCQRDSAADTLANHLHFIEAPAEAVRPLAVVIPGEPGWQFPGVSRGASIKYRNTGNFEVMFEMESKVSGTLTGVTDTSNLADTELANMEADHWNGYTLQMKSGAANGSSAVISDFATGTGALALASALAALPSIGDSYQLNYGSNIADAYTLFLKTLGRVWDDFKALSGTSGYPAFNQVVFDRLGRSDPEKTRTEYIGIVMSGTWGI